jgi:chromosome segregation ATPase
MRTGLLVAMALLAAGCGMRRVPGNVLDRLPYEAKIELLEAENDLAVAVDRLDEARSEVARARDRIRRGKDRRSAASREVSDAKDAPSRLVAELAVTESEKRVDWLRAQQKVNAKEEDLADRNLTCAFARYEQARLAAARKAKLEGSERLDPADFEKQVKDCEARYAEEKDQVKASATEAEAARATWDQARAALAKKTFDARASPFVE